MENILKNLNNPCFKKLDLSYHKIDNQQIMQIADALKINFTLQKLNLSRNLIDVKGATEIGNMLNINSTLQKLDLSYNKIIIEVILKTNKTLRIINLSAN